MSDEPSLRHHDGIDLPPTAERRKPRGLRTFHTLLVFAAIVYLGTRPVHLWMAHVQGPRRAVMYAAGIVAVFSAAVLVVRVMERRRNRQREEPGPLWLPWLLVLLIALAVLVVG